MGIVIVYYLGVVEMDVVFVCEEGIDVVCVIKVFCCVVFVVDCFVYFDDFFGFWCIEFGFFWIGEEIGVLLEEIGVEIVCEECCFVGEVLYEIGFVGFLFELFGLGEKFFW